MKRRTKAILFFTAMFITAGTLFATASRYKHHCQHQNCATKAVQQTQQQANNNTELNQQFKNK